MPYPLLNTPTTIVEQPRSASQATSATVTTGAANTKGAWVNLVASTADDSFLMDLWAWGVAVSATNTSALLDIAIAPAGSADANLVTILPNIAVGYTFPTGLTLAHRWRWPISIPAGYRVAARGQGVIAADVIRCGVDLYGGEPPGGLSTIGIVADYGTNLTTSRGVTLTANAVANTKAATWTEVVASTSLPITRIGLGIQANGSANITTAEVLLDVAVGAALAESIVVADFHSQVNVNEELRIKADLVWPLAVDIPGGSRLSARTSASTASTPIDLIVYGGC